MRQCEPHRAVEIITPTYGTGYCLGGRLLLTCAHLFRGHGLDSPCEVRDKAGFGTVTAQVVWMAAAADIALVELPATIPSYDPIALGQLPAPTAAILDFQCWGFPEWGFTKDDNGHQSGRRDISGKIHLGDTSPDNLVVLDASLRGPSDLQVEKAHQQEKSPWQGSSGSAVVCAGRVVAVLHHHQRSDNPAALEATPLTLVAEDPQWCALLKQHGLDPALAIVSLPDRSTPFQPETIGVPNNLRRSGVKDFVGRDKTLAELHQSVQTKNRIAIVAVGGLRGFPLIPPS